jgi:hypothetical protein
MHSVARQQPPASAIKNTRTTLVRKAEFYARRGERVYESGENARVQANPGGKELRDRNHQRTGWNDAQGQDLQY